MAGTITERRIVGRVIKISEKGFGFITSKDIPFTRIFFHWTSLNQDTAHFTEISRGDEVEFTPMQVEGKGWRAIRIDVLTEGFEDAEEPKND